MSKAESILKSTPPRLPSSTLERARLTELWQGLRGRTLVVLCAPAGFGKTIAMLQWRRRWLQQGAYVAWLSLDALDRPPRFAQGLLHALRVATGQAAFERFAGICALQADRELEAMTSLLAEIARLGTETVLMLDETERLPGPGSRKLLAYLVHNAPGNLHLLVATRVPLAIPTAELAARGQLGEVGAAELRLAQEESCEILSRRFGTRLDLDHCVRLHDASEGWPIALQLAAATIERSSDMTASIEQLSGGSGDLGHYFLECLYSSLPEEIAHFLVRACILDRLEPEACADVTGDARARQHLEWLLRETPVLSESEHGKWLHLHRLARDFLGTRFEQLPPGERARLHARARVRCEQAERFHEAARHAVAEGDAAATQRNAARAVWSLGMQGRISEARSWLRYVPRRMFEEDDELRLCAAWVLVFGERNAEALSIASSVLDDPEAAPRMQLIARRVAGGAAMCADRLDILHGVALDWPAADAHHPVYPLARENGLSLLALHAGANAEVRERAARAPVDEPSSFLSLALAFSRVLLALSYWQDGDAIRVEAILRPLLRELDFDAGRRGMVPCLVAPVLAAALRELGQPQAARAVLADRLDVIERSGGPDTILLAYLALEQVALDLGDERRALHLLENLELLAARRSLPRLAMHALAEGVRLHAQRGRPDTAGTLFRRLEEMRGEFAQAGLQPLQRHYELARALAAVQLALATGDPGTAADQLEIANRLSEPGRMRERLQARALQALVARMRGEAPDMARLQETQSLAELGGLHCLLFDAHPDLAKLLGPRAAAPPPAPPEPKPSVAPAAGALLTRKEAQILALLGQGLPNKTIALSLGIGEETVKWHLKNIYGKLSAGSRKHAVGRARLLGLLPE